MILIITNKYHESSHPNALRVRSFVRSLRTAGKHVHVLQQAGEKSIMIDGAFGEKIFSSKHPKWNDRRSLYVELSKLEFWLFRAVNGQSIKDYISPDALPSIREYKLVLSTGPSFNTFKIAHQIKKQSKAVWIADYRDLWTSKKRIRKTHLSRRILDALDKMAEQRIAPKVDLITTVTDGMANELRKTFIQKKVEVIENGFEDNLNDVNFESRIKDKLIISYCGNIYPNQDNKNIYINAFNSFNKGDHLTELRLVGTELIGRDVKFSRSLKIIPWRTSADFLKELANAHAFIHFTPKGVNVMATTKIYAYLRTGKPIILVEPEEGELLNLAKKCKNLYLVKNQSELKEAISSLHNELHNENIFNLFPVQDQQLSRKYQADKMTELINNLLSK